MINYAEYSENRFPQLEMEASRQYGIYLKLRTSELNPDDSLTLGFYAPHWSMWKWLSISKEDVKKLV